MNATSPETARRQRAELLRLTEALLAGARAGATAELPTLLQRRQALLQSLRAHPADRALYRTLRERDTESRKLLEAHRCRLEGELCRLRDGARALAGYTLPLRALPGLTDFVR